MSSIVNSALFLVSGVTVALAHMVSMSTGEIRVDGLRGRYEFRVPLYEVAHVAEPERTLLDAIKFSTDGKAARRTEGKCQQDSAENALICVALYEFSSPVDVLHVVSSFHTATVSNHVHLLRAVKGDVTDQAVLDFSFPQADIRFRPPSAAEMAVQQSGSGAMRALGGLAQWLFIAALVLAARTRRELLVLSATFFAGELAAAFIVPMTAWQPAPAFVEAAAALTVAYLAVEILAFPEAGQRWLVVLVLGAFHGLYFSIFTTASNFAPARVMFGALVAEAVQIALLGLVFSKLARPLEAWRPVRVAAALLVMTGLAWFALRLKG